MKTFSASYGDFVRYDMKPNEDYRKISKKWPVFAVADGVTQSHYPNGRYALPYGAKDAAHIFGNTVVKVLEQRIGKTASRKAFTQAFDAANEGIRKLNLKHGIEKRMDYTQHDWFDTVGVAGFIMNNTLHYGFVGDCGLIIFNKRNKKKFQTPDMVRPAVERFMKQYPELDTPQKRQFLIRRDYRNNPNKKGYGSFTGQPGVENYYAFGSRKLAPGDMVVLYSDGFVPHLEDPKFAALLREGNKKSMDRYVLEMARKDPAKYGDDRTFIAIVI